MPRKKRAQRKIGRLKKDLKSLQNRVDPFRVHRKLVGNVGFAEQRFLEIMNDRIGLIQEDSIEIFRDLQIAYLDLEIAENKTEEKKIKDGIEQLRFKYNKKAARLKELRELKQAVLEVRQTDKSIDRFAENMQAKFVDWGLIRNRNIKKEIFKVSQKLNEAGKKLSELKKREKEILPGKT